MVSQFRVGFYLKKGADPCGKFTRNTLLAAFCMTALGACNSSSSPSNSAGSQNGSPKPITTTNEGSAPATGPIKSSWLMQDVSVLFPIPTVFPNPNAVHPSLTGPMGTLIPSGLLAKLPLLEPHLSLDTQGTQLELVGVRFDPPQQQIRLVWQIYKTALNPDGTTTIVAFDTAVHAFYQMNDVNSFLVDLSAVDAISANDYHSQSALWVHPTLVRQGMNGTYAQALMGLILKYCGDQTLFRMTFMQSSGEHLHWTFGGFTYASGVINNFLIPKININTTQTFTNSSASATEFVGGIDVVPTGQNEFDALITDSTYPANTTTSEMEQAHFNSITLENPIISPTTATDCASCHVAQMEKLYVEDRVADAASETNNLFAAPGLNMTNLSQDIDRSDNVRAFGYFAGVPSISQRTINDSAYVAQQLNQMLSTTKPNF